jgi:transglutaminase-like putative cysteine protease
MNLQKFLATILGIHVLILAEHYPLWMVGACAGAIAIAFFSAKAWPRWILNVGTILTVIGVFIEFRSLVGPDAAGGVVMVLGAFKLLDMHSSRDFKFLIFVILALLALIILHQQTLGSTILIFIDVVIFFAVLAKIEEHQLNMNWASLKLVLKSVLQTLPIWIFVFVFFPRFSISLGGGTNLNKGITGITDSLDPGSVSSLIQSEALVFRAKLSSAVEMENLYWRGLILSESNGLNWNSGSGSRGVSPGLEKKIVKGNSEVLIRQEILLEPQGSSWLYALDYPVQLQSSQAESRKIKIKSNPGGFVSSVPINQSFLYTAESVPSAELSWNYDSSDDRQYLQVPQIVDPEVKALAEKLKIQGVTAKGIVQASLSFFSREKFFYTLSPGQISAGGSSDSLKIFLFETKRGFCSHFAAAQGTLLRLAGIPSRLVVGFQGGVYNPLSESYVVRLLDAHVWVEYFDSQRQEWVRTDPTTVVAPLRLSLGSEFYSLPEDLRSSPEAAAALANKTFIERGLRQAIYLYDSLGYHWQKFLLSYDFETQSQLRAFLWHWVTTNSQEVFFVSLVILAICGFFLTKWWRQRYLRREEIIAQDVLRQLAKAGFVPKVGEGEGVFFSRVANRYPENKDLLEEFNGLFQQIKYSRNGRSRERLKKLGTLGRKIRRKSFDQRAPFLS